MDRRTRLAPTALVLLGIVGSGVTLSAQTERYRGRLATMPVDYRTALTITGEGVVTAELNGRELTIHATFEGMNSSATAVHIHRAIPGTRGPVAVRLETPAAVAAGELEETITLDATQRTALRAGHYYLQIHTENNADGELRGWLFPQEQD